jgi:hypothetical protein
VVQGEGGGTLSPEARQAAAIAGAS